jgi:hypothetical protein
MKQTDFRTFFQRLLFVLPLITILWACKREFERPRWNTNILTPLVKARLNLQNLSADTSIKVESDQSLTIVQREDLFTYTIDSLVALEAPQFKRTVKLSSLVLSNQSITRAITLGEIARNLKAQGNPVGDQIILAHNLGKLGFAAPIPDINDITAGPVLIDVNQFFQTATLLSGTLTIKAVNNMPLTLSTVHLALSNKVSGNVITDQTFTNLTPGTSQTKVQDLSGQTIEGNLSAAILDLDLKGGTVIVDTSDAILLTLSVTNLDVFEATAIFPAQEVVNETSEVSLLGLGDARLTLATIRQGTVRADVYSTAEDTVRFTYEIPSARKNGQTFKFYAEVPPAPPGGSSYKMFVSDFSGYDLDLTGIDKDTFNTFYGVLIGKIDSTGRVVNLSLNDSLDITLTLQDAKPSYITGYLGQDTVSFGPEQVNLDVFKNIQANVLEFDSIRLNATVVNSLGLPVQGKIIHLQTINTATSQSRILSGGIVDIYQAIAPATDNPFTPVTTKIDLASNSNAVDLLNILPDRLYYIGRFTTNPAGNTNTYTDFARSGVNLNAYMDIEIPLSLKMEQVVLSDTAQFDAASLRAGGVREGTLKLLVENGFPVQINVEMIFLDKNGILMDAQQSSQPVNAAIINTTTGIVEQSTNSVLPFAFSEARFTAIMERCKSVVFKVSMDTEPGNQFVKLYSQYYIDLKVTGDLTVGVNQ